MRGVMLVVVLVWCSETARADSVEAARQRIINDAIKQAYEDSKTLPPVSERAFVKWWRPAFDQLTKDMCACEYNDRTCARLAMDEFTIDTVRIFFRVPGVIDAIERSQDSRTAGRELSEAILKKFVSAKERLRRQAKLERCINYAVGKTFNR